MHSTEWSPPCPNHLPGPTLHYLNSIDYEKNAFLMALNLWANKCRSKINLVKNVLLNY